MADIQKKTVEVWKILPAWFKYDALALLPGVILLKKNHTPSNLLIRHESIHHAQQRELLTILFYLFYAVEFLVRLAQTRNIERAYRKISFEREAEYIALHNVSSRPFWNWVNYL